MNPVFDSSRPRPRAAFPRSIPFRSGPACAAGLLALATGSLVAQQTNDDVVRMDSFSVEAVDVDQILPHDAIDGLFGPALPALKVPGSVSTVSDGIIDRYGIRSTRDLISVVPGSFTPSNYGIDGGLRIRGEDGEVYFRGFRKLQNSALFPTPLGATQQVDVVRGPASPMFGPGRNSGFLNFVPKSARSEYLKAAPEPFGRVSATAGSYDYYKGSIEYGSPVALGDRPGSYFIFSEKVDADSFYENDYDKSWLLQGSFEIDLTDRLTLQTGFMYFDWEGKNNIGWNRVTQELIDQGTYLTGQPIDINGYDGDVGPWLTPSDFSIASGNGPQNFQPYQFNSAFSVFYPFAPIPPEDPNAPGSSLWRLQNVGTTHLSPKKTLVDSVDFVWVENLTAYLDLIYDLGNGLVLKNQFFYDTYKSENYASYGFSGDFHNSVFEDRISLAFKTGEGTGFATDNVVGVSYRYFDGVGKNAFGQGMQHADRRDLSIGATPNDRLIPAFTGERSWSLNEDSQAADLGAFWQSSITIGRLGILAGARIDAFDVETVSAADFSEGTAKDEQTKTSYSIGVNYTTPIGLVPYVNVAESVYLLNDSNGGTYDAAIVGIGDHLQEADLFEVGVKASLLEDRLYATLAFYQQKRARADMFGNPIQLESEGTEFELRYAPSARFSLTAAATWQETMLKDENLFVRVPLAEINRLTGASISPADYYGGVSESTIEFIEMPTEFLAPGQPDQVLSLYGTYTWESGFGITAGATWVPGVSPGYFDHVMLPDYTLVNTTLFYSIKSWSFALRIRNVLDEHYFTPQVFWDDLLVLPSEGRTYDVTVSYSW